MSAGIRVFKVTGRDQRWQHSSRCPNIFYALHIGSAKGNPWVQDINHRVTLWLPWRIGFVRGGNHSIASGVLAGEGEVIPDTVYDMRYLLDIVSTDGYYWYMSGKICERVSDYRTAAFFEIGRLLTL